MIRSGCLAASQSTVFITMVDDGEGGGSGGTQSPGGSVSGRIFGLAVTSVTYGGGNLILDAAGSASGQSFFRQVRIMPIGNLLSSANAAYNSANNLWTWSSGLVGVGNGSFTLQFFR